MTSILVGFSRLDPPDDDHDWFDGNSYDWDDHTGNGTVQKCKHCGVWRIVNEDFPVLISKTQYFPDTRYQLNINESKDDWEISDLIAANKPIPTCEDFIMKKALQ